MNENYKTLSIDNKQSNNVKHLIKEINVLGQEITSDVPGLYIFMYSDGSVVKISK